MRNGSGDEYYVLFQRAGIAVKGFAHESPMASAGAPPNGLFDGFPEEIRGFLTEPAFSMSNATFCFWHVAEGGWESAPAIRPEGPDPDGSEFLLEQWVDSPERYREFAEEYFEVNLLRDTVAHVWAHEPINDAFVQSINPETSIDALRDSLTEIGYPLAP